jgi:DNA-directed RNA polymerase specialized sigma subunit
MKECKKQMIEKEKERKETSLEENVNLVRNIAWSYAKTNGLEFDDLFQEACIAYLEAERVYDKAKGKISTFMYHVICRRLNSLLQNRTLNEIAVEGMEDYLEAVEGTPETQLLAKEHEQELLAMLSPEALAICNIILKEDNIFLPVDTPKKCRGKLYHELRKREWSWSAIWKAFAELKQVFSNSTTHSTTQCPE